MKKNIVKLFMFFSFVTLLSAYMGTLPQTEAIDYLEYYNISNTTGNLSINEGTNYVQEVAGGFKGAFQISGHSGQFLTTDTKVIVYSLFKNIPSGTPPSSISWIWYAPDGQQYAYSDSHVIPSSIDFTYQYVAWDTNYCNLMAQRGNGSWRVDVYSDRQKLDEIVFTLNSGSIGSSFDPLSYVTRNVLGRDFDSSTFFPRDITDTFFTDDIDAISSTEFKNLPDVFQPFDVIWRWYQPGSSTLDSSFRESKTTIFTSGSGSYVVWDTLDISNSGAKDLPGPWALIISTYPSSQSNLVTNFNIIPHNETPTVSLSEQPSPTAKPLCIIATAAFGSSLADEVVYMRHVRDDLIGSSAIGAVLVTAWNSFYYSWSPPIAGAIAGSDGLRTLFRGLLTPLMGVMHVADYQYQSLAWLSPDIAAVTAFLTAAICSIAIYIGTPALMIVGLVKISRLQKNANFQIK